MKKLYQLGLLVFSILAVSVLIACSASTSNSSTSSSSAESEEITITDATGEVTLNTMPEKVVVLDFGVADTIRALGYEDVIVGMPTDSLPDYLSDFADNENVTNVGNLKEVNLTTIAELEPDLIIASGRTSGQLDDFKEIAPTIYFSTDTADYWNSVKTNITELSKIFGDSAQKEAESQLNDLDDQIAEVASANEGTSQTTLVLMLNEGNMSAQGADGRYSFLYQDLGFQPTSLKIEESGRGQKDTGSSSDSTSESSESASSSSETSDSSSSGAGNNYHGSSLSYESINEVNPSIIFVVDRTLAIGGDDSANSDILNNELIQATDAGQNDKIVTLTSDLWYLSGGGLESTKLMIEDVADYAG